MTSTSSPPAPGGRGPVHNADIASAFNEIADILEIEGANPFRIRAYRNAARVVAGLPSEVGAMMARGEDLSELPGIGRDLAQKIADLAATGTTPLLGRLREETPPVVTELLHLPGLGPRRVKLLHEKLGIATLPQLRQALRQGRLAGLPGFGERLTQRLLQAVEAQATASQRMKLATAAQYAEPLLAYLSGLPGVENAMVAGSYRRSRETVGDLDFVVAAKPADIVERFTRYPEVSRILAHGPTRGTATLRCGLQVDIRVVARESYGAALVYFTGSKAHNIAIRRLAQERGLKVNEYGVFRGGRRIAGDSEESVYGAVGLPLIPPELREDRGEIEAARHDRLPALVKLEDIRGDLHVHTTATDGRNSLRDMALAAARLGYAYIAVTEHSRRVTVAHGLDPARLSRQGIEIDRLNREDLGITVLKGIEVDILEDGKLDLPDSSLAKLDVVIGAVHSKFHLDRERQTERILRSLDSPYMTMLAHPTGRLIGEREAYDVDMPAILRKARERGRFVELNAHPDRLDLLDIHCRIAKEIGVPVSINTDAHSVHDYANMRFGIGQARRGWLDRNDVLNTRTLPQLKRLLAASRGR